MKLLKPLRTLHVFSMTLGIIFSTILILGIIASIVGSLHDAANFEPVGKGPEMQPTFVCSSIHNQRPCSLFGVLAEVPFGVLLVIALGIERPLFGLPIFLFFFAWFYYRELKKDVATIDRQGALIRESLRISGLVTLACTALLCLYFAGSIILTSVVILPLFSVIYFIVFKQRSRNLNKKDRE